MFRDREEAAQRLGQRLSAFQGRNPLVLAIPRGGVPMGKLLADQLGGEFDVVLARKLRAPLQPELAVGAVDESGWTYIDPSAATHGADADYLAAETRTQMRTIHTRRSQYTRLRAPISPAGRTTIVVDDGLATGATMVAALHAVRSHRPLWLVCAVPVAAHAALRKVQLLADEVVCLETPEPFRSVGQCYSYFGPVDDDEVAALLGT